ncbi:MAG: SMC-Scp complex subunit ScpB [Steroidobacteraceae bacterium]
MNATELAVLLEAALLAAGRHLPVAELGEMFEEGQRPAADELREALRLVAERCEGRAYELLETASGFRLQIRREFALPVSRLWPERPARYSRALLETLALIAYRQPLTRAEIEAVRGVAVNPNIIKTLFERNWIRVVGHRELPGRPELLGTTRDFLDYFGLRTLAQLPPLAELKSLEDLDPQLALPEPLGPVEASNEPDLSAEPAVMVPAVPGNDQESTDAAAPGEEAANG